MKAICLLSLCVLLSTPLMHSEAALKRASDPVRAESAFNPNPDPMDFEVPLPRGMNMVFRAVPIPAKNFLYDRKFLLGHPGASGDRLLYEKSHAAYISAPLRLRDLSENWQRKLSANHQAPAFYYFIGKYEVTNGQWAAVMGEECAPEAARLPKTNASWYDWQRFLENLNRWLLSQNAAHLPFSDGMPAFLRLPTEEEWEFAAKGGALPPEERVSGEFPKASDKQVSDYAVFGSEFSDVQPVGSRLPNPLGLYDTGGNAAELVEGRFQMTIPSENGYRLHGSSGGLLSKGGSFAAVEEADVFPGSRTEIRTFNKKDGVFQPFKARDLGARLVLTSLNFPGHQRSAEIQKEFSEARKDSAFSAPEAKPVLASSRASQEAFSPSEKKRLEEENQRLKNEIQELRFLSGREHSEKLGELLRSLLYLGRCFQDRITILTFNLEFYLASVSEGASPQEKAKLRKQLAEEYGNLKGLEKFYGFILLQASKFPAQEIQDALSILKSEYAGSPQLRVLGKNIESVEQDLKCSARPDENCKGTSVFRGTLEPDTEIQIKRILGYF